MSTKLDDLKHEAASLSHAERAELALSLIESLEAPTDDGDAERAWQLEVEKRAAELESGDVQAVPGDVAFGRLRRQPG